MYDFYHLRMEDIKFYTLITYIVVCLWQPSDGAVVNYQCSRDWVLYRHECLKVHQTHLPWHQAAATCEAEGGMLVTIKDKGKNFITQQLIRATKWIGLKIASRSSLGVMAKL